ncbi:MAG: hypothetical protein H6999_10200 [Hahellaceae bacterium]|nr:hypothetical protein [Hahellaceae bacterium]MCP5170113.1 hypothetical protein [Hahellaceae bacterium]
MGLFSAFGSFESKTINIAMEALQKNVHVVPESSTEYFPPPEIIKATLKSNFFPEQSKRSLQRDYGVAKPEYAAYHLLDLVGRLFLQEMKPDMGAWFMAAKDSLRVYMK